VSSYSDFAEYDEWAVLEAILDKKDIRVPHMMELLGFGRLRSAFRTGRALGVLILKRTIRTGSEEWVLVERCVIISGVRFRQWIAANKPSVEQKLCAVEVDRHFRGSLGDQRV
jgi:hypothetical protein